MRKPTEFADFPVELNAGFGPFNAISRPDLQHDDGDTLWFMTDKATNDYSFLGVRLKGINAPEKRGETREDGLAAFAYLLTLIPLNAPVQLTTDKDTEKYGRYVGTLIYLRDSVKRCVNVDMVLAGHADPVEEWGWNEVVQFCVDRELAIGPLEG